MSHLERGTAERGAGAPFTGMRPRSRPRGANRDACAGCYGRNSESDVPRSPARPASAGIASQANAPERRRALAIVYLLVSAPAWEAMRDQWDLEGEEAGLVKVRRRNWARLIRKVWLEDPELCPQCGETMKILAAIPSPAQDEVIEKILRARGEWDPPWLRARLPRGPPPGSGGGLTRIHYDEGCDPGDLHEELDQDQDFGLEDA